MRLSQVRNLIYCQVNLFKHNRCHIHSCSRMHELIPLIVLIHSSIETDTKALALSIVEGNPQNSTPKIFHIREKKGSQEFCKICTFLPRITLISTPLAMDPVFPLAQGTKDNHHPEFRALRTLLSTQKVSNFESFFLILPPSS